MNFEHYAQMGQALYADFAATIKLILEKSIASTGAPRPQSVQCRAKSADSLRPKLEARELLQSDSIEDGIKDLAGVRLIFYTNTDVDRFLNARLIPDGFQLDWKESRIHHPTRENARQRYQAIHYTVYLSAERLALPEYARFKGMRCEIQIQTILNHAWAETHHDILYKKPGAPGFGTRAFEAIETRMNRLMDDYLLPAGYELQKVQHDFDRLMQGKALFDRGTLETLTQCDNNNDRHDTLARIREYVLPNYDDIPGIYHELCSALADAVRAARVSVPKPTVSTFGALRGRTAEDVATLALNILDDLRYFDVERTFYTVAQIYRDEVNGGTRERVLEIVKKLAAYNINLWQRAGFAVQYTLAEIVARTTPDDRLALRPLIVAIWSALLHPEMRGTSERAFDQITLSTGAVPASDALSTIRSRAITGLLEVWDESSSEVEYWEVFSALSSACCMPIHGASNELRAAILNDSKRIISSLSDRLPGKPYELLQHIEHRLLWEYRRARAIAEEAQDRFACREIARNLITAIFAVRDRLNADEQYVRYKTLVGFKTVLPPSWESYDFDLKDATQYRSDRAAEYIEEINEETEGIWYRFLCRCAETESQDLATFPAFCYFLVQLAKEKPATVICFVQKNDAHLMRFLPAFLDGLRQSGADAGYRALLAGYVSEGRNLAAIAQHYRMTKTASPGQISEILDKAMAAEENTAVIECLILAIGQATSPACALVERVFVPAIEYLTAHNDTRWVYDWSMDEAGEFLSSLPAATLDLVLKNLNIMPRIDYCAEQLLVSIAAGHSDAVWQFFGRRLNRQHHVDNARYEVIPYQVSGLKNALGQDADAAIVQVRSWFRSGDALFRFGGAHLLSVVFSGFPEPFAAKLLDMAEHGSDEDLSFILAVMQNYLGEPSTHGVLQAVVNRLDEKDPRLGQVEIAMQNTGVVSGEFGLVDAFRKKKEEASAWIDDPRPRVKAFAKEYIRKIESDIVREQRAAEQELELRRRNFEADG